MDISNKPLDELILRLYEAPSGKGRDFLRKVCLSCGLLNPHDSRDVIVDVFQVLISSSKQEKWLSSMDIGIEVRDLRESEGLSLDGTANSNIRRILKVLRDYGFVERSKAKYRIVDFKPVAEVFGDIMSKKCEKIISRIKSYLQKV